MNKYLDIVAEMLEVDTVEPSDEFESFDSWDSLAVLSIIAAIQSNYGVVISAKDISEAKTVGGLFAIVEDKKK